MKPSLCWKASIEPQRSPTFRSGKIGGWHDAFTDEHRHLFEQDCRRSGRPPRL